MRSALPSHPLCLLMTALPSPWIRGSLLGSGSFGHVYLAVDPYSGHLFAVKSIDCSDMKTQDLASIDNELDILQSLDSPHVVGFLGSSYSLENGVLMRNLLMEYMPGGSLSDMIAKFGGRLEEPLVRVYTRGIVEGLLYLHDRGIVHCDIKSKNILVGPCGVKIADFGSAKRIERSSSTTTLRGTPLWMAPEVLLQVEQGPASDIWSLGCTVLEMATGHPPWSDSPNAVSALYRIACTDELPTFPRFLSLQARDFLEKCLQKDPKARWTSAQLLKHPFLSDNTSSAFLSCVDANPPSPTSIFHFPSSSSWGDSMPKSVTCNLKSEASEKIRKMSQEIGQTSEINWITVRSLQGSSQARQIPLSKFMLEPLVGGKEELGKAQETTPELKDGCSPLLSRVYKEVHTDSHGRQINLFQEPVQVHLGMEKAKISKKDLLLKPAIVYSSKGCNTGYYMQCTHSSIKELCCRSMPFLLIFQSYSKSSSSSPCKNVSFESHVPTFNPFVNRIHEIFIH